MDEDSRRKGAVTLALSRYNVDDWACNSAEIKSSRGEASSRLSFSEQGKYFLLPCMKGVHRGCKFIFYTWRIQSLEEYNANVSDA